LLDILTNAPALHIFGAGHVGKSVADLAHFLQMDVYIYDDRSDLATHQRFHYAREIFHEPPYESAPIAPQDAVLVSTRDHRMDLEKMSWLLKRKIAYLGLMSSQRKWKLLSDELMRSGFCATDIQRVKAPVGLDIGSDTVPEIALSIMSEIIHILKKGSQPSLSLSEIQT